MTSLLLCGGVSCRRSFRLTTFLAILVAMAVPTAPPTRAPTGPATIVPAITESPAATPILALCEESCRALIDLKNGERGNLTVGADLAEAEQTLEVVSSSDPQKPAIVFLGDSITEAWLGTNMVLESKNLGTSTLTGPGAGRFPTANSIVADVHRIYTGKAGRVPFPSKPSSSSADFKIATDFVACFYLRWSVVNKSDASGNNTISTIAKSVGVELQPTTTDDCYCYALTKEKITYSVKPFETVFQIFPPTHSWPTKS